MVFKCFMRILFSPIKSNNKYSENFSYNTFKWAKKWHFYKKYPKMSHSTRPVCELV